MMPEDFRLIVQSHDYTAESRFDRGDLLALNNAVLVKGTSKNSSFPRRRKSGSLTLQDSRLRGSDETRVIRGALI